MFERALSGTLLAAAWLGTFFLVPTGTSGEQSERDLRNHDRRSRGRLQQRLSRLPEGRCATLALGLDRFPFAAERGHQHRLEQREDVVLTGVVGADLRALGGIEGALE